jgi:hypothetical protein
LLLVAVGSSSHLDSDKITLSVLRTIETRKVRVPYCLL